MKAIITLVIAVFLYVNNAYGQQCTTPPSMLLNGNFELPIDISSSSVNDINNNLLGWTVSHGTPSTAGSVAAGNNRVMWLWSYCSGGCPNLNAVRGEGIFNCFAFQSGATYQLCFDVRTNGRPSANVEVRAISGLFANNGGTSSITFANFSSQLIYAQDMSTLHTPTGNNNIGMNPAVRITQTFTVDDDYTELWFYPFLPFGPTGGNVPPGSNYQGSMSIDNVVLTLLDSTDYVASGDGNICPGDLAQLSASGGQNYEWSVISGDMNSLSCLNCPNPTAQPMETTNYNVAIIDSNLCEPINRQVTVTVDSCSNCIGVNMDITTNTGSMIQCIDDCNGSFNFSLGTSSNGLEPYSYSVYNSGQVVVLSGGNYSQSDPSIIVDNLCAGMYQVVFTDANGCTDSTIYNMNSPAPIAMSMSSFPSLCLDDNPIILNQGNPDGGIYEGNGITNSPSFDPGLAGVGNHAIEYVYTSSSGCTDTAYGNIQVEDELADCGPPCKLVAPNAFTPDNDMLNNTFELFPTCSSLLSFFNLKIYNRWGEVVFTSNDLSNEWNGEYKNKSALMDTYTYIVQYAFENGEEEKLFGCISLIR